MRILHVSEVSWGGVVSLLRQFVAHQQGQHHEVGLLAPPSLPQLDGVQRFSWSIDRRRPTTYPSALLELTRTVRVFQPDVVHLHSFMAGFVGRVTLGAKPTRPPLVYQPHAWAFDMVSPGGVKQSALEAWERLSSHRTEALVTNCQDEVDEGLRAGVRLDAHPVGVSLDFEHFRPCSQQEREAHRQRLNIRSRHSLVCIGRLVRQKGQDQLLAAWESDPPPDTELVLVGPGDVAPLRAIAPTQWGRSIRAVGEQDDVRPWLWACDALVLPSRYETVAVVVAEALACGRPVIATRVNGVQEVVADGDWPAAGRIVPAGDMASFLAECRHLINNHRQLRAMSDAARQRAEHYFSSTAVGQRLEAAYHAAIDKRSGVRKSASPAHASLAGN